MAGLVITALNYMRQVRIIVDGEATRRSGRRHVAGPISRAYMSTFSISLMPSIRHGSPGWRTSM